MIYDEKDRKLKADLKFSEVEASFVDVLICRKIRFFMML
jgi:hypothetical protein